MNNTKFSVASLYKPPSHPSMTNSDLNRGFISNLESLLSKMTKSSLVFCDTNINSLISNDLLSQLSDTLITNGFSNKISLASRITLTSSTAIDHCYSNILDSDIKSGIIVTDISDHFPVFLSISKKSKNVNFDQSKPPRRYFTCKNISKFRSLLEATNWNSVTNCQNSSNAYLEFNNIWIYLFNLAFPLTKQTKNRRLNRINEFFTVGLLKSRITKISLYRKFIACRNRHNELAYKNYRNIYNKVVKLARTKFYENMVDKCKDPKSAWKYLNKAIGRNKEGSSITSLSVEGHIISDPKIIANKFNTHFANAAESIAKSIPKTDSTFEQFLPDYTSEGFKFKKINYSHIEDIVDKLE